MDCAGGLGDNGIFRLFLRRDPLLSNPLLPTAARSGQILFPQLFTDTLNKPFGLRAQVFAFADKDTVTDCGEEG